MLQKKAAFLAALLVCLCFGGCREKEMQLFASELTVQAEADDPSPSSAPVQEMADGILEEEPAQMSEDQLYVDVCGAVCYPGVYQLPLGSRVFQAIDAAGGFRADAASAAINQALPLEDGQQLYVPTAREGEEEDSSLQALAGQEGQAMTRGPSQTLASQGVQAAAAGSEEETIVNINTADKDQLMTLNGIGESRAQAILDYRRTNGGFSRIEDIMNVQGIGKGLFARMQGHICV